MTTDRYQTSKTLTIIASRCSKFHNIRSPQSWHLARVCRLTPGSVERELSIASSLQFEEFCIAAWLRHQLIVCASGFDHSVGEDENAVGHANAGKTMRDQDGRLAVTEFLEALEYFKLGASIQRRRRLVEDQHGRFAHIGAGDRDFLPFPTGKLNTVLEPFADHLLIAIQQSADHLVGLAAAPRRAFDPGVV